MLRFASQAFQGLKNGPCYIRIAMNGEKGRAWKDPWGGIWMAQVPTKSVYSKLHDSGLAKVVWFMGKSGDKFLGLVFFDPEGKIIYASRTNAGYPPAEARDLAGSMLIGQKSLFPVKT